VIVETGEERIAIKPTVLVGWQILVKAIIDSPPYWRGGEGLKVLETHV
jgi:hypothetical protein